MATTKKQAASKAEADSETTEAAPRGSVAITSGNVPLRVPWGDGTFFPDVPGGAEPTG